MNTLTLLEQLNIFAQCRRLGVSPWSCPPFLFTVMGIFIMIAILATYIVGQRYADTEIITLIILLLTAFLLVIAHIITRAFEKVVEARLAEREGAEKIIALKDQFVFVAAHELRVPATAIKWSLEKVGERREAFSDAEKESLDIAEKNNNRLLLLVRDLLEVARIEGRKMGIERESVSLAEVSVRAVAELRMLADARSISIANDISADIPGVWGDEVRIEEVFHNLISNAVNYGKKGGHVVLSAERKGSLVYVHVADNGIGISETEQKRLFEKFWRSPAVRETVGTGLGLFIVKQLLGLMSGRIWVLSHLGKGSTFSFSLPIAE